ncbi:MAG: hypothetical protein CMH61_02605 [Nanoarchaeota archaeon]|nr:hypothetical protein [Nanoarchaeota archaeon]|tara:strand:+ start:214 stop:597 length:384 start_codon:yes stop_codon:yes gene_type:complete
MAELIDGDIVQIDAKQEAVKLHPRINASILDGLDEMDKSVLRGISNSTHDEIPYSIKSDLSNALAGGYSDRNHLSFVMYTAMREVGELQHLSYEKMLIYVDDEIGTHLPDEFHDNYADSVKSLVNKN